MSPEPREEYSALVVCFLIKQVKVGGQNPNDVFRRLDGFFSPFVGDLPSDDHAYDYLEAMRCVSINLITGVDLWSAITENYRMDLSNGFSVDRLNAVISVSGGVRNLGNILTGVGTSSVRFMAANRDDLAAKLAELGYPEDAVAKLLELHDGGLMNDEEIKQYVRSKMPTLAKVEAVWSTTKLHQSIHTALGKALAHSALVSRAAFDGPLEIWVR
ncbi:hypothetical protein OIU13_14800 [Brevundimonas sp. BT-123]|uniref:LPO_1073/Vpar_1526 family protein n=1 Tax=Brevundimonas sp. BT-123 TaxID=2986928 RepID=UPI002236340B|nr:LPO_1073/Vpar_1526 family protein [Brevundimonas sp. BT-123]MCW0047796.1 hypothetical protein [Brevundimonas sp. BT-123]